MRFVAAISQGFRTCLKPNAILLRQKLHRVAENRLCKLAFSRWNRDPAAGHVTTQNLGGRNLLEGWGILSSSQPNVLEYPPILRFWMDRWSRDQPQPGSLFQRLREAEKRDPGNEVDVVFAVLIGTRHFPSRPNFLRCSRPYFNFVMAACPSQKLWLNGRFPSCLFFKASPGAHSFI